MHKKMCEKIKKLLCIATMIFTVCVLCFVYVAEVSAYTEEQKQSAKAWLSSHGYSPTKEGAYSALADFREGRLTLSESEREAAKAAGIEVYSDNDDSDTKSNTEESTKEKKKKKKKKKKKNKKKKAANNKSSDSKDSYTYNGKTESKTESNTEIKTEIITDNKEEVVNEETAKQKNEPAAADNIEEETDNQPAGNVENKNNSIESILFFGILGTIIMGIIIMLMKKLCN